MQLQAGAGCRGFRWCRRVGRAQVRRVRRGVQRRTATARARGAASRPAATHHTYTHQVPVLVYPKGGAKLSQTRTSCELTLSKGKLECAAPTLQVKLATTVHTAKTLQVKSGQLLSTATRWKSMEIFRNDNVTPAKIFKLTAVWRVLKKSSRHYTRICAVYTRTHTHTNCVFTFLRR